MWEIIQMLYVWRMAAAALMRMRSQIPEIQ